MTRRVVLGAPNEERFGFSQAVARDGWVGVSGQVGKDNRTGEMVAADLAGQLRQAVANVREAAGAAGDARLVSLTAHLPGPLADGVPLLREALAAVPACALTVVGVPALSHDTYRAELSALATMDDTTRIDAGDDAALPWAPAAVAAGGVVHVSACHGHDPDPGAALAEALAAVAAVLARAGCDMADVLSEHVHVVRPVSGDGFAAICDAHRAAYAAGAPASTLVLVDELVGGATASVSVIAKATTETGAQT